MKSNICGSVASEPIKILQKRSASKLKPKLFPGRKLTDTVVRSSSGIDHCFSSDLLEPRNKLMKMEHEVMSTNIKPKVDFSSSANVITSAFNVFHSLLLLTISSTIILFAAVLGFRWMQSRCEFLHNLNYDVNKFQQNFSATIIGQPYASALIPSALADFESDESMEPRIVWCVGWTGVGKSKSLGLIKHLDTHYSIHYILPSLLPDTNNELEEFITKTIMGMNSCLKNILIVDGWDEKYDSTTMNFISGFLAKMKEKAKEISHMSRVLVFVAGTRKGEVINREYMVRRERGEKRDQMSSSVFADAVSNNEEYNFLKSLGPLTVVPFLPLEVKHVAECANREIVELKERHRRIDASQDDIFRRLLEHIPLMPSKDLLISATGCKKVLSALTLVLKNELLD